MKNVLLNYLAVITIATVFLTGCGPKTNNTVENKVTFDSLKVDLTYHLFNKESNPNCTFGMQFTYPTTADNKELLSKLQEAFVEGYFGTEYEGLSPKDAVNKYKDNYLSSYKELEPEFENEMKTATETPNWYSYYETTKNTITYNKNGLICTSVYFENYTGGAHGSHAYNNLIFNYETGDFITEEDIFVEDYQDKLAKIIVNAITKKNNLTNPKELEENGYFSADEIFPNGNILVDEEGITYTYNEYEIAAYVMGQTIVKLPFNDIIDLLKEDGPIAKLAHK